MTDSETFLQGEPGQSWMTCISCGTGNPPHHRFCSRCGTGISLTGGTLEANVQRAIDLGLPQALKRHLTDSNLVELQLAERVADRLSKWLKYVGIPAGALVAAFSLFGLQTSLDLSRSHERVQSSIGQLQQRVDAATKSLGDIERLAETARSKANSAAKQTEGLEGQVAKAGISLARAQQMVADLDGQRKEIAKLRTQVNVIEGLLVAAPRVAERQKAIDTLARTIWGEARGDGVEGMEAIAAVVANRSNNTFLGDTTVEAVCLRRWQFPSWNENDPSFKTIQSVTDSNLVFKVAIDIATRTIDGKLQDRTAGATHYHVRTLTREPAWANKNLITVVLGNHVFYRLL